MSLIHKPLDRALKAFPAEALRLFLHIAGILPLDAKADIEVLSAETAPPVKIADFVARMKLADRDEFILHVEYEAMWQTRTPSLMARRGGSLAWQYGIAVESLVLLVKPDRCPEQIPSVGVFVVGETRTTHPFRTLRMWELDPAPLLRSNDARVLPWAVLMKSTDDEVRKLAREVMALGDEELSARLLTLGGVRYDREELERITGGNMDLVEIIMQESSFVKWVKSVGAEEGQAKGRIEGHIEGRAEGQAEGKAIEACRILRTVLAAKYPGLESMPELSQITDVELIESLVERIVRSTDRASTEEMIRAAVAR